MNQAFDPLPPVNLHLGFLKAAKKLESIAAMKHEVRKYIERDIKNSLRFALNLIPYPKDAP